jgi:hypothetical protein
MSWLITPQYLGAAVSDADAQAYLRAVETADNQGPLEQGVQQAVNQFVIGCKADGIWTAIKASCILAGARTLAGALVPLVGTAPTNVDGLFISGDYDRKTGLVGDGSTKYLNSNRNNNADPQNSQHLAVYASTISTQAGSRYIGYGAGTDGRSTIGTSTINPASFRSRSNSLSTSSLGIASGSQLLGVSRATSSAFNVRSNQQNQSFSVASQTPSAGNIEVFRADIDPTSARLAFYSIGESLNLALLDARVTTLINAFDAAI